MVWGHGCHQTLYIHMVWGHRCCQITRILYGLVAPMAPTKTCKFRVSRGVYSQTPVPYLLAMYEHTRFLIHGFWAGRKSHIFGPPEKPFQKVGCFSPLLLKGFSRPPGPPRPPNRRFLVGPRILDFSFWGSSRKSSRTGLIIGLPL